MGFIDKFFSAAEQTMDLVDGGDKEKVPKDAPKDVKLLEAKSKDNSRKVEEWAKSQATSFVGLVMSIDHELLTDEESDRTRKENIAKMVDIIAKGYVRGLREGARIIAEDDDSSDCDH